MTVEIPVLVAAGTLVCVYLAGVLTGLWPRDVIRERNAARADRARLQEQLAATQADVLTNWQRAVRAEKAFTAAYTKAYGAPPRPGDPAA